jgi:hypothetical protein
VFTVDLEPGIGGNDPLEIYAVDWLRLCSFAAWLRDRAAGGYKVESLGLRARQDAVGKQAVGREDKLETEGSKQ